MNEEWALTTVGEAANVVNGGTPSTTNEEYWGGDIVWITTTELTSFDGRMVSSSKRTLTEEGLKSGPARKVRKGTTLLGTTATVGTCALAGCDLAFNQQISGLAPKKSDLDDNFLFYLLQTKKHVLEGLSAGTSFKRISTSVLKTIPIAYPPLAQQKRIVDLIASVDSYLQTLEGQLKKLTKSRNAVLFELLNKRGDDWVETQLGLISNVVMGQAPLGSRCNKDGLGTPFVKAGEFQSNRPKIVEWTTDPLKMAKSTDVLVCVVGATAGKINLGADCAIGRSVAAVRPGDKLHQLFLYYVLSLELDNLRSGSRGSAQGVITKDDLHRILVLLPSINEQNRIVDLISSMDETLETLRVAHNAAKKLREGLLFDLLNGNHAIPSSYDKVLGATQ